MYKLLARLQICIFIKVNRIKPIHIGNILLYVIGTFIITWIINKNAINIINEKLFYSIFGLAVIFHNVV